MVNIWYRVSSGRLQFGAVCTTQMYCQFCLWLCWGCQIRLYIVRLRPLVFKIFVEVCSSTYINTCMCLRKSVYSPRLWRVVSSNIRSNQFVHACLFIFSRNNRSGRCGTRLKKRLPRSGLFLLYKHLHCGCMIFLSEIVPWKYRLFALFQVPFHILSYWHWDQLHRVPLPEPNVCNHIHAHWSGKQDADSLDKCGYLGSTLIHPRPLLLEHLHSFKCLLSTSTFATSEDATQLRLTAAQERGSLKDIGNTCGRNNKRHWDIYLRSLNEN